MKLLKTKNGDTTDYDVVLDPKERKAAGVDDSDETSVLSLLAEYLEFDKRWDGIRARARRNSRFIAGDQREDYRFEDGERRVEVYGGNTDRAPYTVRNLLRSPHQALSSRVLEGKPTVAAYAGTTEPEDIAAAEVSNTLISFYTNETNLEPKDFRAANKSQAHGVVFFRPRWDASAGPVSAGEQETETYDYEDEFGELIEEERDVIDEDGNPIMFGVGEREGDIAIDLVTVHDVTTDGSPNIEDSPFCVFRNFIDCHSATAMLREAGIDGDPQEMQGDMEHTFEDAETTAVARTGVVVFEVWVRPSTRIPGGLYAEVVGGQVTVATEYPYAHEQLPLCAWRWAEAGDEDQIAPKTHVDDAINEQIAVNKLLGAIDYMTEKFARVKSYSPKRLQDAVTDDEDHFYINDPDEAQMIGFAPIPSIPPIMGEQLRERSNAVYTTFGLTDQMSGVSNAGASTAARKLAYESELAAQKQTGVVLNYEECKRRMWAQVLSLVKQFVVSERRELVLGEGEEYAELAFVGADIDGTDVRLEGSLSRTRAAAAAEAEQLAANGLMDPVQAAEISETGLPTTLDEGESRRRVAEQIGNVLQGLEAPQALPDVDALVAAQVVHEAIATIGESPELRALLEAYRAGAVQVAPAPPGGAGPQDQQAVEQAMATEGLNTGVMQ